MYRLRRLRLRLRLRCSSPHMSLNQQYDFQKCQLSKYDLLLTWPWFWMSLWISAFKIFRPLSSKVSGWHWRGHKLLGFTPGHILRIFYCVPTRDRGIMPWSKRALWKLWQGSETLKIYFLLVQNVHVGKVKRLTWTTSPVRGHSACWWFTWINEMKMKWMSLTTSQIWAKANCSIFQA